MHYTSLTVLVSQKHLAKILTCVKKQYVTIFIKPSYTYKQGISVRCKIIMFAWHIWLCILLHRAFIKHILGEKQTNLYFEKHISIFRTNVNSPYTSSECLLVITGRVMQKKWGPFALNVGSWWELFFYITLTTLVHEKRKCWIVL